jgi:hypothetical protein
MRLARLNPGYVVADAVMSLSKALHDGKTVLLSVLTGHTITLPPATGSGCKFNFLERVAATSGNNVIKVANTTDVMIGSVTVVAAVSNSFPTVAASDTVTLNRGTQGGATNGGWLLVEDVAPGFWAVSGQVNGSGTPATPFGATV